MKMLQVSAAVLDIRHLRPAVLEGYDEIRLETATLITSPETQALLQQYPVQVDSAYVETCEPDVVLNTINGKVNLTGSNDPAGRQILLVNGKLNIQPDAGDVLRRYAKIIINGKATCPQSLVPVVVGQCVINGKLVSYPDDAVVLGGRAAKLNKNFLLRAQGRLYWHDRLFVAADPKLDAAALAARGARFSAPRAILYESIAEQLAPLFTDDTELVLVPDGTAIVEDDLELTAAAQRRHGSCLYVLGDVTVPQERAADLTALESLRVEGDVRLPAALEEDFLAIPELEYNKLQVLSGRIFADLPLLRLAPEMLELYPEGLVCVDCARVNLDPAFPPDTIAKKLRFDSCAMVCCTKLQQNAVAAVCCDVAKIKLTDEETPEEDKVTRLFGAQLTL